MNFMKKSTKKKLTLSAFFGGFLAVTAGALAFFTSTDETSTKARMGTVQVLPHYYDYLRGYTPTEDDKWANPVEVKTDIEGQDWRVLRPDDSGEYQEDVRDYEKSYLQNKTNVNPGDEVNSPSYKEPDEDYPGSVTTNHALRFGFTSRSLKSVRTRNVIDIWVKANENAECMDMANGYYPYEGYTSGSTGNEYQKPYMDPRYCALYEREGGTNVSEDPASGYWKSDAFHNEELIGKDVSKVIYETEDKNGQKYEVLRYVIGGARLNGLPGNLEDNDIHGAYDNEQGEHVESNLLLSETRPSVKLTRNNEVTDRGFNAVDYLYYLGLGSTAGNEYMGATIYIRIQVQAMQYRNTVGNNTETGWDEDGDWEVVYDNVLNTGNKLLTLLELGLEDGVGSNGIGEKDFIKLPGMTDGRTEIEKSEQTSSENIQDEKRSSESQENTPDSPESKMTPEN